MKAKRAPVSLGLWFPPWFLNLPFVETETSAHMKQEMKEEKENQAGTLYLIIYMKKAVLPLQ